MTDPAGADRRLERSLEERTDELPTLLALYSATKEHAQELEALYRADEELYRSLNLDQVLQSLVDVAVDILHADKSSLMIWDCNQERLRLQAARGFKPETLPQLTFAPDEGLAGRAASSGQPVIVEDAGRDPAVAHHITEAEEIRSFMHVPLKIGGQVFGVFNVNYSQPHAFGDREQRLFMALARRAALAIKHAQHYEQAQQAAAVEERQRLARELHDAVTQTLFSASLIAEVLPRLWARNQAEARRRLEELRQLARGALAEMRTLLLELRPSALTEASLGELLRHLTEALTGRTRTPATLEIESDGQLPAEIQVVLYRITQEALNNVAKHARAGRAWVKLRCRPDQVELSIEDDGCGFDLKEISPDHLGLAIMQERAESIGAELQIQTRPQQGTRIKVIWPNQAPGESR